MRKFVNGSVLYLGESHYCLDEDYFIYNARKNSYVFSKDFVKPNYMALDYVESKELNNHKKDVIYRFELPGEETIFMVRHFDEKIIFSGNSELLISNFIKGGYLTICE